MRKLLPILVCLPLMAACAGRGATQDTGSGAMASEGAPGLESGQSKATYHLMLGELALERGYQEEAVREMLLAAEYGSDPQVAERATELALAAGDAAGAERGARRWVALDPDSFTAQRYLMRLLLDRGEVAEALPLLQHVRASFRQTDPGQPDLNVLSVLLEGNDMDAAALAMERAAGDAPWPADTAYALATLHMAAGDLARAGDYAEAARQADPSWVAAAMLAARVLMARGDTEQGLQLAGEAVGKSDEPGEQLAYGAMLASADRFGQAREVLLPLLEQYPNLPAVLRTLGFVEYQAREWDEARQYFSRLLATGQDYEEANFYLASIALAQGQPAEALLRFREVEPGNYYILAQLGIRDAFLEQGFVDSAILHLQDVGRWRLEYSVAMHSAEAEMLSDLGRYEEAMAVYDRGLLKHPGELEFRLGRAFAMDRAGDLDGSIKLLRKLAREKPDNATVLNALGYTLADRTTRYREAYKLLDKAYRMEPYNAAIIDSMGWVEYRRGNLEQAEAHLRRALRLARDPEISAHLGEVLWAMGRQDEASEIWRQAQERDPEDRVLREVVERFSR